MLRAARTLLEVGRENREAREAARTARTFLKRVAEGVGARPGRHVRRQLALKDAEISALKKALARVRGEASPAGGTPVFFVVGQKKSGTTWLMRMLDAHPEILCKGEGRFFGAGWKREALKESGVQELPSSLHEALLDSEYLRCWIQRSVWSRNEDPEEHLTNIMRMVSDYFLEGELLKTGKTLVGDKSPLLVPGTIKEVREVYPEARVIHIIRDGRDAAVSAMHHTWNFGNVRENSKMAEKREAYRRNPLELLEADQSIFAGNLLRKAAWEWTTLVGSVVEDGPKLLGDNYREVRYEDLLERPGEEVGKLLEFLGARSDERAVGRCIGTASFEKLSEGRKRGQEDPTSFFRKGVAGEWKNVFTRRDRRIFKEESGELLVRLGYEKDDNW